MVLVGSGARTVTSHSFIVCIVHSLRDDGFSDVRCIRISGIFCSLTPIWMGHFGHLRNCSFLASVAAREFPMGWLGIYFCQEREDQNHLKSLRYARFYGPNQTEVESLYSQNFAEVLAAALIYGGGNIRCLKSRCYPRYGCDNESKDEK